MVNSLSIFFMAASIVLCFGVPIAAIIYNYKKYRISFLNVLTGAGIFILFALILERSMHIYLLQTNLNTSTVINSSPWIFALYGAFAAGIFEETGRFVAFKVLLKGRHRREDGIAYGIGHGGIEAILVGGLTLIQNLYFAILINSGKLSSTLGAKLSNIQLNQISSTLINTNPYLFLVSGFERTVTFIIQIGLSMVVLYAVRSKKYRYLFLAILLHAIIDFPAGMYQKGLISNIWIIEIMCLAFAVISFIFIKNWNKVFKCDDKLI